MIFSSQGKSKQARAILLGEVHPEKYDMRSCNRLNTEIPICCLASHCRCLQSNASQRLLAVIGQDFLPAAANNKRLRSVENTITSVQAQPFASSAER
jgi:hypothetical protein